jgi:hypothetical protein
LSDPSGNYALVDYAVLLGVGTALGAAGGALNALACGGDVGSGAIFGAAMGLGFTALALIIGPQASLVLGMGSSTIGMMHASADMQLNGINPCNGMQLTLAIAGLWLGAQNFHSGPPSIGMTPNGGAVIMSGESLVVVGNTVTTLEQLLSILSLYMAIEEGGGGSGDNDEEVPGKSSYSEEEWNARIEVTKKWPSGRCLDCASEMQHLSDDWGEQDIVVGLFSEKYGKTLLGPNGKDIGAGDGWHAITVDRFGNAWDNFGYHYSANKYISSILSENPGAFSKEFLNTSMLIYFRIIWVNSH